MNLPEQVVAVHRSLAAADVAHAFGGAIALAYCVPDARATVDMDVNVFVSREHAPDVLAHLPDGVEHDDQDLDEIERDGQVRLWWDQTPVDLFFNTTGFHEAAALRVRRGTFGPVELPVLACRDLAVFKAFFDRRKDWTDLAAMAEAGALDVAAVAGVLAVHLGPDDDRLRRLLELGSSSADVSGRQR